MRALVWTAPERMEMQEQPEPAPTASEVVIRVAYAGICGSELSGYLGHNALRTPPLVMGHEFAGEIVETGRDVTGFETGDAVTVNPLTYCGHCRTCRLGLTQLCPERRLVGAHRPGAFAEYVSIPAFLVHRLPDGMSLRTGALTEPVGVGVRIGALAGEVAGESALVIGAGPIGLLALQALKLAGAERIFIADLDPERLAMGGALGGITFSPAAPGTDDAGQGPGLVEFVKEETAGDGVAVSVDAVGTGGTRSQCVAATRSAGTLILSGLHEETSAMPAAAIIRQELTVRGSFAYAATDFAQGLDQLHAGNYRLDPWIVEAPLADGGEWFQRLIHSPGNVSKVLLVPDKN
ncbi:MAG: alcohol dehydrogenase catalytic domain-containing protein [Caldilineaceae bacterium]|nr:alcohol dehydrogenase catalytic domain-containing protein [Caldilineaceae bacterium]